MSGRSMRRNWHTSSGTRSPWTSQTYTPTGYRFAPSMFQIDARGGLGRKGIWTRGDRTLPTPLVLFVHQTSRPAPSYAEGLLVAERTGDARFQVRVGGSFFAPRAPRHLDDLPPGKGTPRSFADLEIPQDPVAGRLGRHRGGIGPRGGQVRRRALLVERTGVRTVPAGIRRGGPPGARDPGPREGSRRDRPGDPVEPFGARVRRNRCRRLEPDAPRLCSSALPHGRRHGPHRRRGPRRVRLSGVRGGRGPPSPQ